MDQKLTTNSFTPCKRGLRQYLAIRRSKGQPPKSNRRPARIYDEDNNVSNTSATSLSRDFATFFSGIT